MVVCPECNREVGRDARGCDACGVRFSACPSCKARISGLAENCPACGLHVAPPKWLQTLFLIVSAALAVPATVAKRLFRRRKRLATMGFAVRPWGGVHAIVPEGLPVPCGWVDRVRLEDGTLWVGALMIDSQMFQVQTALWVAKKSLYEGQFKDKARYVLEETTVLSLDGIVLIGDVENPEAAAIRLMETTDWK